MARSVNTIFQNMLAEKANQSTLTGLATTITDEQQLLDELASTSKVSIWVLWLYITAVAIAAFEQIMDVFKADVDASMAQNVYGTRRWWVSRLLAFQYGDALGFPNDQPQYPTITPANQIVAAAAAVETAGTVTLKAAKLSGSALVALTTPERTALEEYVAQLAPAGVATAVISNDADILRIEATIFVDPLVISTSVGSEGQLLTDASVYPVEDAVNAYLAGLPFDGLVNLTHLKDAVQLVEGVNDFVIDVAQYKVGAGPYTGFTRLYSTVSGYIVEDSSSGNTFADLFTYSAGQ